MPALTAANDLVRARNVSASEVYALMGPHPYSSPSKIYDQAHVARTRSAPTDGLDGARLLHGEVNRTLRSYDARR